MTVPEEIEKQTAAEIPDFSPDLNDPRLTGVKAEGDAAVSESNEAYDKLIENSESFYQGQIENAGKFEETLKKNQQDQTDFAIEKIEQQKDEAQKDYTKEQSGAYADWQKQSNAYGIEAEKRALNGMTNTGYSESSQVAMYNAYQNRVATARESLNKAMLNFDNAIKDAMLQNNAALAEIAFQTFQMTSQLALEGFNNGQSLLLDKLNTGVQIKQHYDNKYLSTLDQIYNEMAMEEDARQYNQTFGLQQEELDLDLADQKLALEREDAGTLLTLAKMGIKVPLTEGLKKMGITQSMLDSIINMGSAVSVSSGGGSGSTGGSKSNSYSNTYLKQLYKDGDYDTFFTALAERGDIIAEAQALGISAHEVNYLNDKGLTSLEQVKYMLKNHGNEKYSDTDVKRMLSGAYTEDEFYGSGHQMSAYDSYEDYLNNHFKKFINF